MRLEDVIRISLTCKSDDRGSLTIVGHEEIPFNIARMFYLHDVTSGSERGGHAHRVTEQFIIPIAGEFMLDLTDGQDTRTFEMIDPNQGVYVPPIIWDRLYSFSIDAVCLVLASTQYAESDYIRDWNIFLDARQKMRNESTIP